MAASATMTRAEIKAHVRQSLEGMAERQRQRVLTHEPLLENMREYARLYREIGKQSNA